MTVYPFVRLFWYFAMKISVLTDLEMPFLCTGMCFWCG